MSDTFQQRPTAHSATQIHFNLNGYRGRIAPTPTGLLHLGHARTFKMAAERAKKAQGSLVLRVEDLDRQRCKPEFVATLTEDLKWLEIEWQEGPEIGGPFAPYLQSARTHLYLSAWQQLKDNGWIYPCYRSRKDVLSAPTAPHDEETETIFPPDWRPAPGTGREALNPSGSNWRFRVPDGEPIEFHDGRCGQKTFTAGTDFGDFLVWRRDDTPAYELAVVVDDIAMHITEVVRGEDLLKSTARQLLLYHALGATALPTFYHCPLVRDEHGHRLAKRSQSLSLRALRAAGKTLSDVLTESIQP